MTVLRVKRCSWWKDGRRIRISHGCVCAKAPIERWFFGAEVGFVEGLYELKSQGDMDAWLRCGGWL
jgi:hypothetical protein